MRRPRLPPSPKGASAVPAADAAANVKRSAANAMAGGSSPAFGVGGAAAAKRRRTVVPVAALTAKIVALEAAVASGSREIAELEADNARLSIENTTLRLRPRLPEPPAALQQLVRALGMRERDLRDHVFELACMPRYLARPARIRRGFSGRSRSLFRWAPS